MPKPVTIFNANEVALTIAVNRGAVAVLGRRRHVLGSRDEHAIGWSNDGAAPVKLAPGVNESSSSSAPARRCTWR